MECIRCGAMAMVEGSLMEMTAGGGVSFVFKEGSMLRRIFGSASRGITAFVCAHCSHIELMVKLTEKDRKRFREFDGPQPDLLERIGQ